MINNKISLSPASVALVLGITAFVLILAGLAGQLGPYFAGSGEVVTLFNLNSEHNIPAFFSMLLILAAALLLALIAVFKKAEGETYALYWAVLACGFMFMAVDEVMAIHEKLNEPMNRLLGKERSGIFYFPWVAAGIVLVIGVGLFFLKFLRHLPTKTRFLFLAAAAFYLGGVIVVELIGNYFAAAHGTKSWTFIVSGAVEEGLEMAGMIVFILALLKYMAEIYGEVRFRFDDSGNVFRERRLPNTLKGPVIPLGSGSPAVRRRVR